MNTSVWIISSGRRSSANLCVHLRPGICVVQHLGILVRKPPLDGSDSVVCGFFRRTWQSRLVDLAVIRGIDEAGDSASARAACRRVAFAPRRITTSSLLWLCQGGPVHQRHSPERGNIAPHGEHTRVRSGDGSAELFCVSAICSVHVSIGRHGFEPIRTHASVHYVLSQLGAFLEPTVLVSVDTVPTHLYSDGAICHSQSGCLCSKPWMKSGLVIFSEIVRRGLSLLLLGRAHRPKGGFMHRCR